MWGDGHQKRELVLVDDFVKILWELSQRFDNDIFNIGAGQEFSIRTFAELISNYVGYSSDLISYDENRYFGSKSKCLNIEKIKEHLPTYSLQSLEFGLKNTIDWFYRKLTL